MRSWITTYQLPIVSGILIGTSYIPFPPWALFFCFIPLWVFLLKSKTIKQAIIGAWVTSFILTLIGFYWVAYVIREHGHIPWALSIPGMLVFCAISTYYIPVAAGLAKWAQQKLQFTPTAFLALTLITFAGMEKIRYTLFPWHLGYSWHWARWPGLHLAEYIGFDGLSTLTFLINFCFALCFINFKVSRKKTGVIALFTLALILTLQILGQYTLEHLAPFDKKMKVLIIQGNVGNLEKERAEKGNLYRTQIIEKYLSEAQQQIDKIGASNIDFIVFPETAMPVFISKYSYTKPRQIMIADFVKKNKVPLVTGAYYHQPETDQVSNSLFVFNSEGQSLGLPYRKTKLLAFGEYVPIVEYFPWLENLIGMGSFARGNGPEKKTIITQTGTEFHFGPQICYESLFPLFSKELSDLDAQFFINLTNDSWFGPNSEPYQNLYMTLARSIEFRRPVLRATNTGFTAVSLANGEILPKSKLFTLQSLYYQIPFHEHPKKTFFQIFPYSSEVFLAFLFIGLALYKFKVKPEN